MNYLKEDGSLNWSFTWLYLAFCFLLFGFIGIIAGDYQTGWAFIINGGFCLFYMVEEDSGIFDIKA